MIDLGSIAFGPELERRRIIPEIARLRGALMPELMPPTIEIVYFIPGSLGKADFDGFEVRRSRAGGRHVLVYVDVPRDVAESSEPMAALVDLARSALEYARASRSRKGMSSVSDSSDYDELLRSLDVAAATVLGPDYARAERDRHIPAARPSRTQEADQGDEAGVMVRLWIDEDPSALTAAFALEDELEQRLAATHSGYVDGNEVGQGTFDIYAYGPSLDKLRSEVESLVRHRWTRAGATLRILDGDDEVETLTT